MKIKDLILLLLLQKLGPEENLVFYCADDGLKTNEGKIQIFSFSEIIKDAEVARLNDGQSKPWVVPEKTINSSKMTLIEITSDI